MSPSTKHPVFARVYAKIAPLADAAGVAAHRDELLAGASGRVVEVGAGSGRNFAHYPTEVTEVLAVEPEPYLRSLAEEAAAGLADTGPAVTVVEGTADALPCPEASFDVAVFSLVLCSVPDVGVALAEARRVLRPGGELRFYEHVVADTPRLATWQRRIDPVWSRVGGGCHTARDPAAAIEAGGFTMSEHRTFRFEPGLLAKPVSPHVLGIAHR